MAIELKWRDGGTFANSGFIGEKYEGVIDNEKHTIVVHDGVNYGGVPMSLITHTHDRRTDITNMGTMSLIDDVPEQIYGLARYNNTWADAACEELADARIRNKAVEDNESLDSEHTHIAVEITNMTNMVYQDDAILNLTRLTESARNKDEWKEYKGYSWFADRRLTTDEVAIFGDPLDPTIQSIMIHTHDEPLNELFRAQMGGKMLSVDDVPDDGKMYALSYKDWSEMEQASFYNFVDFSDTPFVYDDWQYAAIELSNSLTRFYFTYRIPVGLIFRTEQDPKDNLIFAIST